MKSIEIYPNPTKNEINITLPDKNNESVIISINSVNGREIFEKKYGNIESQIKITGFKAERGIYLVKVLMDSDIYIKKIIVN